MEIYFAVTPILAHQQCEKCKAGYLIHTGQTIDGPVVSYHHKCNNEKCLFSTYYRGIAYPQFRNVVNQCPIDPQPNFEI